MSKYKILAITLARGGSKGIKNKNIKKISGKPLIFYTIKEALKSNLISDNDCLVVLGKGHEQTQEINGKTFHFSDHEVVNEIYK